MEACENYSDFNSFISLQEAGSLLLVFKVNYVLFFSLSKSLDYVTQKYVGVIDKAFRKNEGHSFAVSPSFAFSQAHTHLSQTHSGRLGSELSQRVRDSGAGWMQTASELGSPHWAGQQIWIGAWIMYR